MNQENKPLVTVVTVTYNLIKAGREEYFQQCLESVHNQTYKNIEHVIIDGASTDGTIDLIKEYKNDGWIKYISESDDGIYDAMNKGIEMAKGEWIYFLGSDDFLYNDFVFEDIFKNNLENIDVLYGNVGWNNKEHVYDGEFSGFKLMFQNICHQSMLFKSNIFKQKGEYDSRYKIFADWAFNLECFNDDDINIKYIDKKVAVFRTDGTSAGTLKDTEFEKEKRNIIARWFTKESIVLFDTMTDIEDNINIKNIVDYSDEYVDILLKIIKEQDSEINKMQESKFWKVRNKYITLKERFKYNLSIK